MADTEIGGVLETCIYGTDLDAMEQFYGRVLGLRLHHRAGNRHLFYFCGSGMLLVFNPDQTRLPSVETEITVPVHGTAGAGHVCFAVDEAALATVVAKLEDAGHPIEADFRWPNGVRSVYARDPAGNSIEFADRSLWFTKTSQSQ